MLWFNCSKSLANQPNPSGRFKQAETLVGQPLDYELRYEHAPDEEVVFPDSLADFRPFQYAGRNWFPTRTRHGRSLDRAVYHLRTFALDPVQRLSLPVLVLRGGGQDTLRLMTAPAQVRLRRTAPAPPVGGPAPALRQDLALQPLTPDFNYPYWLAGLLGVLTLGAGASTLFGQRLRRRYAAYKRRKNHVYFLAQFARYAERFNLSRSATNVERAVVLWKNYLSALENNNINSLTTKEIVAHYQNDPEVRRALRATDRVVYANLLTEDAQEVDVAFQRLRAFAEQRYALTSG